MGTLPPDPDVFQWHSDTFDLPPGATLLARSEACRQAFRCGDSVYGVQFHPEMTDRLIEEWRVEGQRPLFAEPPGACGRLAELCDRTIAGWSGLL
jgi:GMP synthase-like glutamine amidotransferase